MSNTDYIPLPKESPAQLEIEHEEQEVLKSRPRQASGPTVLRTNDLRFNPPPPSPLKRAALLLFVFWLFWFALRLRTAKPPGPSPALTTEKYLLVHSTDHALSFTLPRYSTDFDYRPAVSSERIKKTRKGFRGA